MSILTGSSFFYALFKDLWSKASSQWRGRSLLRAEVFRQWTVDQWYPPFAAIRQFADQDLVERSDEAHQEALRVWKELPSEAGITPDEYRSARDRADAVSARAKVVGELLRADLEARLVSGELISRGSKNLFLTARLISPSPAMNGE